MAKKFKLKGDTTDEKFAHIEQLLKHWQRRARKTLIGVIPPSPIFSYTHYPMEDGTVLKCVIPADGRIVRGVLAVDKYNTKEQVGFMCKVERASEISAQSFLTKKNLYVLDVALDVRVGDILTVKIDPVKNDEGDWIAEVIWLSLLYEIGIKDTIKKQYLIEDLERMLEKDDEGV